MKLRLVYRLVLLLVLIGLVSSCREEMEKEAGLSLLSDQEAKKLLMTEKELTAMTEWQQPLRTRGLKTRGPRIVVEIPKLKPSDNEPIMEMAVPAELKIVFEEDGTPVDMNTLNIVASKFGLSKSLTNRIKPYINGTEIHVKELNMPNGKFWVQVEISDTGVGKTEVGKTVKNYRVKVKKR